MYIELVKLSAINLFMSIIIFKILKDKKICNLKKIFILLSSCFITCFEYLTKKYVDIVSVLFLSYFLYSFIICKLTSTNFGYSLLITVISCSISFLLYFISTFITAILVSIIPNYNYENILTIFGALGIETTFIFLIFKIKRFRNGFPFLQINKYNHYLDILIFIICITSLFIYFLMSNYSVISFKDTSIIITIFILVLSITLYKSFIIYQKQKLLEKTLKDYEQEIAESKNKLEILLKEKNNLVKANHEFYHRQQALNLKLDNLIKSNKTLFKEEYGSIIDRIDTLSKEYTTTISNTETQAILPKTNISEIDDMFIYMQNECKKNNIDFTLRLTSDIYQLINNIIPKNKFETLIGDLIRNSIIAINYSSNTNRAIMIILGIKDNTYEFSIYDTGIEFKIETLSKLGLEHATTHADTGGTGIGFITTFETLKYCNASLIITEFSDKNFNYTKSITIKFDSKNNYIIETYRADQFPENQRVKIYPTNIKI